MLKPYYEECHGDECHGSVMGTGLNRHLLSFKNSVKKVPSPLTLSKPVPLFFPGQTKERNAKIYHKILAFLSI